MTRLHKSVTAAAITAIAAAVFLPLPARAGEALLWACHGPGGNPLGAVPLSRSATRDGRAREYGGGCDAEGTGGVEATFSRPDPEGGSAALWELAVPAGVALESLRMARATTGFGETPVTEDPQWYETKTSNKVVESASLEVGETPLGGLLEAAVGGRYVRFGVGCRLAPGERCTAPPNGTVGVEVSSIALGVRDERPPTGAVGGRISPIDVGETQVLSLDASDAGLGLANAQAAIDGRTAGFVRLGSGACPEHPAASATIDLPLGATGCPSRASSVALSVPWNGVAAGSHELRVSVSDAAGNTATLVDETIEVSDPPQPGSNTIEIGIASEGPPFGPPTSPGEQGRHGGHGGSGGVLGASSTAEACPSPMLSMRLVSKPLRRVRVQRRRVPLLRAGRRYRYRGTLTCLPAGAHRRVSAPDGTIVHVLYRIGRHTFRAGRGTMTVHKGRLSALLRYRSSRTVVFRYTTAGHVLLQVKIPTVIAHRHAKKARAKSRKGHKTR